MANKRQSINRYKKRHTTATVPAASATVPAVSATVPAASPAGITSTVPAASATVPAASPAGTNATVPAASPAGKKKRNIFIHPDHKEDLDATYARLDKNKVDVHDTGYTTHMQLINRASRWNGLRRFFSTIFEHVGFPKDYFAPIFRRRILLHGVFVRKKLPTRTAFIFTTPAKPDGTRDVYLQGCPVHYMQRTSVFHIARRSFSFFRWYGYYADLDMTPEPQTVLLNTNMSPFLPSYTYTLAEQNGRDQHLNDVFNYRLIPKS